MIASLFIQDEARRRWCGNAANALRHSSRVSLLDTFISCFSSWNNLSAGFGDEAHEKKKGSVVRGYQLLRVYAEEGIGRPIAT